MITAENNLYNPWESQAGNGSCHPHKNEGEKAGVSKKKKAQPTEFNF